MFTDSKQILTIMTRGKRLTERLLVIEVFAAREAYQRFEIDCVGLIRGEFNASNDLSEVKNNGRLSHLLLVGLDKTSVEQWILRCNFSKDNDNEPVFSPTTVPVVI